MANPKTTHLGDPRNTPHIDHFVRVREVNNCHKYEMLCTCCNKHVKWANLQEFVWISTRSKPVRFRTLWWAPRYDKDYQFIQDEIFKIKMGVEQ